MQLDSDGNQVDFAEDVTFSDPWCVAVDEDGYVYVADDCAKKVVKLTPSTNIEQQ